MFSNRFLFIKALVFFNLVFGTLQSQNTKKENLEAILKTAKEDTNKVNLLLELAELDWSDSIVSLPYINKAYSLSEKIKFYKGMVKSLNSYGNMYIEAGQFNSAWFNLEK